MKQTFTREEVINLIKVLITNPAQIMDAITNEHTDFGEEELLEEAEYMVSQNYHL